LNTIPLTSSYQYVELSNTGASNGLRVCTKSGFLHHVDTSQDHANVLETSKSPELSNALFNHTAPSDGTDGSVAYSIILDTVVQPNDSLIFKTDVDGLFQYVPSIGVDGSKSKNTASCNTFWVPSHTYTSSSSTLTK
jgi:hypothetical protein